MRELINALEYAVVTAEGNSIGLADLPYDSVGERRAPEASDENGRLERVEQEEILRALERFGGNRTRTAEFLGINRKTLREKIRRYDLEPHC